MPRMILDDNQMALRKRRLENLHMTVGFRLKRARCMMDIERREMILILRSYGDPLAGWSETRLRDLEQGRFGVSMDMLLAFADIYDVSLDWLTGRVPESSWTPSTRPLNEAEMARRGARPWSPLRGYREGFLGPQTNRRRFLRKVKREKLGKLAKKRASGRVRTDSDDPRMSEKSADGPPEPTLIPL